MEKPFFLWLGATAPHLPMRPNPPRIRQLYSDKAEKDLQPPGFPAGIEPRGGDWVSYYEAITHLDEQVGRILDALEERKLAENTVVVFLGDNGYMMGSRGWNGKVVPYEESVRVPFFIRIPKTGGLRGASDAPVSSLDLPPTFLRMAGIRPPAEWPGRDLTPLLEGKKDHGIEEAICVWADDRSDRFGELAYRVVRTSSHKLIRWQKADKPDELYDLKSDPREERNLASDPSLRTIRDDLSRRLTAWMQRTDDPARGWKK